ncbi:BlaI/MecI/CopY family transcriptional regulator [Clostridium sp.]|uniref:BlaI/MecI/CopY family transcriptional regulator n=1 Tax=Clostridium sp. TaxID=1506 RepID=UPI002FDE57FD
MSTSKISDSEWQVMKIIWSHKHCTAKEIVDKLSKITNWQPNTIRTLINRLLKKKIIDYTIDEKDNKTYHYFALVSESKCIKIESESFLKRVFNGSLNVMLENFINENKLSEDEIDKLKQILDKKKKG